jgi:hypothetical protein
MILYRSAAAAHHQQAARIVGAHSCQRKAKSDQLAACRALVSIRLPPTILRFAGE